MFQRVNCLETLTDTHANTLREAFGLDGNAKSHARWFSYLSLPKWLKTLPLDSGKKNAHHVRPNQQQYKRLVYLNMRACAELYAAQMCPLPQLR